MRFWTNFVFCDHRITSQHNTTTVNLFLVVTAQRFLDKNLAWECWYDSVPYCFCSIFWARDPLSTSPTRQVWKPPNSTAVYRTSAEVHLHLPYPYNLYRQGNTLHLNCSKFTNRSGLCFCVILSTRLVIVDVNVEISLRFLLYNYLSPDRTLLKTLHKNGAPQAGNFCFWRRFGLIS